jgi:hypothetical protein
LVIFNDILVIITHGWRAKIWNRKTAAQSRVAVLFIYIRCEISCGKSVDFVFEIAIIAFMVLNFSVSDALFAENCTTIRAIYYKIVFLQRLAAARAAVHTGTNSSQILGVISGHIKSPYSKSRVKLVVT